MEENLFLLVYFDVTLIWNQINVLHNCKTKNVNWNSKCSFSVIYYQTSY
jgi:hypothetical protein